MTKDNSDSIEVLTRIKASLDNYRQGHYPVDVHRMYDEMEAVEKKLKNDKAITNASRVVRSILGLYARECLTQTLHTMRLRRDMVEKLEKMISLLS